MNEEVNLKIPPNNQTMIVRQNALSHADKWLETVLTAKESVVEDFEKIKEQYFNFAEECEKWVKR